MQSDSASCHALCVPHKDAPDCYAVDGGVRLNTHILNYATGMQLNARCRKQQIPAWISQMVWRL